MLSHVPFFFVFSLFFLATCAHILDNYDGNAQRVPFKDEDTLGMYQKWVDTGLSSLMAAFANKRLKKHRAIVANNFGKCSSEAGSIPKHAKCIVNLIEQRSDELTRRPPRDRMARYGKKMTVSDQWSGGFRVEKQRSKRHVAKADRYEIKSAQSERLMTPLGSIAKLLMESILAKKNKTRGQIPRWQETVSRIQEVGDRRKKIQKQLEEDSEESLDQMAFRGIKQQVGKDTMDIDALIRDPVKRREFLKKAKNKKNKKPAEKVMDLVRDGFKLAYAMAGQNTSDFDEKNMKLISPRFLGVVPEEKNNNDINLLSPSLFSLHNDGEGLENITSLATILNGLPMKEQQIWLDLIMEASGVNDEKDKLETEMDTAEQLRKFKQNGSFAFDPKVMVDKNGVPLYFTKENVTKIGGTFEKRKAETFEALQKMYTKDQMHEMNKTGYAALNDEQLHFLYGPQSPYNNSEALQRLLKLKPHKDINTHIEKDVKSLSEVDNFKVQQKDIVLSPIAFTSLVLVAGLASQPIVLSPIIFSPLILSPSVFGAVILSPWMFVPLALSPRVLGALVLSPFIFAPIILTPLVLHPAILSPGVFNPLVLSPVVLVPFILSPQVFTPLILSPLVLSPIILNPLAGSPLVLSPFVLSPIIGSPQFLGALFMSPYALSPVLLSPLIAFAAILSPSFLS